jgi:lipid A disaccharide synthetase
MPNYIDDAVNNFIRKRKKQVNTIPDDPINANPPPNNTPSTPQDDSDIQNQMKNVYQHQLQQRQQQQFAQQMQKQVQTQNAQDDMEKLAQAQIRQQNGYGLKKPRKTKSM